MVPTGERFVPFLGTGFFWSEIMVCKEEKTEGRLRKAKHKAREGSEACYALRMLPILYNSELNVE